MESHSIIWAWHLKMQNKTDEAYDAFYKAVWNDAWQHAGYLQLARIACMHGDESVH